MSSFELDAKAFVRSAEVALKAFEVGTKVEVTRLAGVAVREAQQRARVNTGEMRARIHHESGIDALGFYEDVISPTPQSWYNEFGTAPHRINARPGGVLVFKVGGQTVFTTSVNHPGTSAAPFMTPALLGLVNHLQAPPM